MLSFILMIPVYLLMLWAFMLIIYWTFYVLFYLPFVLVNKIIPNENLAFFLTAIGMIVLLQCIK